MNLKLVLPFLLLSYHGNAQSTATVDLTFENAKRINIERRSFLKEHDNFTVTKIDQSHYVINYLDNKAGVVFVNGRPILITPGDHVQFTYRLIVWNYDQFADTVFASGENSKFYTYSNFVAHRLIKGDIFPDLRSQKYQTNGQLLYSDLQKAYAVREAYYYSYLKKGDYDNNFSDYVKRWNHIEFLSNAIALEIELFEKYREQHAAFAEKVHNVFLNTEFVPSDTSYNYRMEETIYSFFWHYAHCEYSPIDNKTNFEKLLKFTIGYPNSFVREYFLFFLIRDYNAQWLKYVSQNTRLLAFNIKNPAIKRAIENYKY